MGKEEFFIKKEDYLTAFSKLNYDIKFVYAYCTKHVRGECKPFTSVSHKSWVKEECSFSIWWNEKLIMYDSKKTEAFNTFFNLTEKVKLWSGNENSQDMEKKLRGGKVQSQKKWVAHSEDRLQSLNQTLSTNCF